MGIKSEAAVPNAWIYVDVKGMDVGTYVQMAMRAVNEAVAKGTIKLPSGYNIFWSGEYEYMLRAKQRLMIVVPLTLLIIILIIYLNTRSAIKTAIVMLAVPFSLVGAFWHPLPARLQPERGGVGRHHRAGRPRRRNRRGHAAVPGPRLRGVEEKGLMRNVDRLARRHLPRRRQARPPQSHDRLRHHRRPAAHSLEPRRRRRRDEAHRHADDRRRRHLHHHGTAGLSGHLLPVARRAPSAGRLTRRKNQMPAT